MSLQYMMTQPVLDEINREVASLSKDEQLLLSQTAEYKKAKDAYEAGFLMFLGNKFGAEYVLTNEGKMYAGQLLDTIRNSKQKIKQQLQAKEERINKLLQIMESDPQIKKRMDEILLNE